MNLDTSHIAVVRIAMMNLDTCEFSHGLDDDGHTVYRINLHLLTGAGFHNRLLKLPLLRLNMVARANKLDA